MKKSTMLFATFVVVAVLLVTSCQALFDSVKESFTTVVARYVENGIGGIEIRLVSRYVRNLV